MDKNSLLEVLSVFRSTRNKLLFDFADEKPSIFTSMFKYENNELLMNISIEDYFLSWINYHFLLYNENSDNSSPHYLLFINAMDTLLNQYIVNKSDKHTWSGEFVFTLLKEKQNILKGILNVSDKLEVNYKKLLHLYEKDKALFNRYYKSLKEDK